MLKARLTELLENFDDFISRQSAFTDLVEQRLNRFDSKFGDLENMLKLQMIFQGTIVLELLVALVKTLTANDPTLLP